MVTCGKMRIGDTWHSSFHVACAVKTGIVHCVTSYDLAVNIKYLFGLIRSFKDLTPMKKSKILDKQHVTTMQSKDITKPSPITAINKPKYVVMT